MVVLNTLTDQSFRRTRLSFSNMSYKLNLKLATMNGKERSWKIVSDWVEEVPTLIIGISMASGKFRIDCCSSPHLCVKLKFIIFFQAAGQDSLMTVVGTALLDNTGLNHKQELCVQKKGPLIAEKVIIEIVKVNANHEIVCYV